MNFLKENLFRLKGSQVIQQIILFFPDKLLHLKSSIFPLHFIKFLSKSQRKKLENLIYCNDGQFAYKGHDWRSIISHSAELKLEHIQN